MILFNIEGPKGSGKSTVTRRLADELNAEIIKFDSDNVVEYDDFEYAKSHDVIFERGMVSYQIYDWLWNNGLSEQLDRGFSRMNLTVKQPMNQKQYDYFFEQMDGPLIILYSSNVNELSRRIHKRDDAIGKGANDLEWKTLVASNTWFEHFGAILKAIYPEKVVVLDIMKYSTQELMYGKIKSILKGE